jgi:hypothetical protein
VTASVPATVQLDLIVELAARHRLPAVYWDRLFVPSGGLISYGADVVDQCRRAADYVDRILRGEKPADLPVQAPTKYELVINLQTAKALGLDLPASVLARADEVIEWPELCSCTLLHLLRSPPVQVFGRRHRRSDRTLRWPASEKRQGTKSRREVVLRQCRKLTGAPRALMGIWALGWAGSCPAVTSGVVGLI